MLMSINASEIKMEAIFVSAFEDWKKKNEKAYIMDIQYQATNPVPSNLSVSGYSAPQDRVLIIGRW